MRAFDAPQGFPEVCDGRHVCETYQLLGEVATTDEMRGDCRVEKTRGIGDLGNRLA
jgi:hypothetical protein